MKQRLFASVVLCLGLVGTTGCDKPSESSCKKAVANIRELFGTARMSVDTVADSAWIRACRATAKHSSVKCAIEAKSLEQLKACGLLKGKQLEELEAVERDLKALQPPPVAVDAGMPPAVDAAAATDDAAAGSGSGSAAGSGSGSGSAAGSGSGSAAGSGSGSATGSGSGSAAGSGSGSAAVAPTAGSAATPTAPAPAAPTP